MNPRKLIGLYAKESEKYFSREEAEALKQRMLALHRGWCREHADDPPALKQHTENTIYVGMALYRALQEKGMEPREAFEMTDRIFQGLSRRVAGLLRGLLKIPGLYRRVPVIVRKLMPKKYSFEAGFQYSFYDVGNKRVKFDVSACPYYNTCRAMGCPELTPIFCNSDDVCYGRMHPRLLWHRSKTIGRGQELCDFDITVTD